MGNYTARRRYIMQAMRSLGPAANREIAREVGCSAEQCYVWLSDLRRLGLAEKWGPEMYWLTTEGLRELGTDPATELVKRMEPTLF